MDCNGMAQRWWTIKEENAASIHAHGRYWTQRPPLCKQQGAGSSPIVGSHFLGLNSPTEPGLHRSGARRLGLVWPFCGRAPTLGAILLACGRGEARLLPRVTISIIITNRLGRTGHSWGCPARRAADLSDRHQKQGAGRRSSPAGSLAVMLYSVVLISHRLLAAIHPP